MKKTLYVCTCLSLCVLFFNGLPSQSVIARGHGELPYAGTDKALCLIFPLHGQRHSAIAIYTVVKGLHPYCSLLWEPLRSAGLHVIELYSPAMTEERRGHVSLALHNANSFALLKYKREGERAQVTSV